VALLDQDTRLRRLKEEKLRRLRLQRRPPSLQEFVEKTVQFKLHEWQAKHLCPLMERFTKEKGLRIAVHAPPQYGKSIIVSKRFVPFVLGLNPLARIVLACYNVTTATEFGKVCRNIMHTPEYKEMFPNPSGHLPSVCSAESFSTQAQLNLHDSQGSFTAIGLQTGFTGKGLGPGEILLIDDPYASPDEARSETINEATWRFHTEVVEARVHAEANVLLMFHRYHPDDYAGRVLAQDGWENYRFPAIADENEDGADPTGREIGELLSPKHSLDHLLKKREQDPLTFLGMFQGTPRDPSGNLVKREWLRKLEYPMPPIDRWVRFWDLATATGKTKKNSNRDYTAGALVAIGPDHTVYVKDIVRFRAEWPDAQDIIARICEDDYLHCQNAGARYDVGIEEVAWQLPMIQDLFNNAMTERVPLWPVKPTKKKKDRASGWFARAKYGCFRMVPGAWNDDFINECLAFDGEELTHDDQVDAVSGAYELLWDIRGGLIHEEKPTSNNDPDYHKQLAIANGWADPEPDDTY